MVSLFFQKKFVPGKSLNRVKKGKRGGCRSEKGTLGGGRCLEMDSSVNLNNGYRRGKVTERH